MNNQLKHRFFIVAMLLQVAMHAQTPGYMGKRFALSYGFYFSPAIIGANAKGHTMIGRDESNSETGYFAFNSQHQLGIEFVLKNHISMGLAATYYKTMYDNSMYLTNSSEPPAGTYDIRGFNYSLYFKFYRKQSLAPYGRYFMVGATLNTTRSTYDPAYMKATVQENYSYYYGLKKADFGPVEQSYKRFDLLLGWGKNRIIANRVLIDYGINLQLMGTLNALFGPESFDLDGVNFEFSNTNNASNYISNTTKVRNREVNKFNVFLKVGVLLF